MTNIKSLLLIALFLSCTANATNLDVHGKGNKFIKVTEDNSGQAVNFKLCVAAQPNQCSPIGEREYYLKSDLEELRNSEKWDVLKSLGADIAIVASTTYLGAIGSIGAAVVGWGNLYTLPIYAGIGAGVAVDVAIDSLNPAEQYKQLDTLSPKVLNDETVFVKCTSEIFAKRLAAVLDNL